MNPLALVDGAVLAAVGLYGMRHPARARVPAITDVPELAGRPVRWARVLTALVLALGVVTMLDAVLG